MAAGDRLGHGEWRLRETDTGWRLSFRSQVRMGEILAQEQVGWFLFGLGLIFVRAYPQSLYLAGRYFQGNRVHEVEVHDCFLETEEGQFHSHLLESARVTSEGALPGRFVIVFDGHAVTDARLVGWPGFSREAADAILAGVQHHAPDGMPRAEAGLAVHGLSDGG
jgi:hypothetical protein